MSTMRTTAFIRKSGWLASATVRPGRRPLHRRRCRKTSSPHECPTGLVSLLVSAMTSRRWPQCPETPTRWRSGGTRALDPARDDVALNVVRDGSEVADFKSVQYPAPVTNSGKVGKTHSVCSVGDHNLGLVIIAEIALKNANAVPPTYFFSQAPNTAYVNS